MKDNVGFGEWDCPQSQRETEWDAAELDEQGVKSMYGNRIEGNRNAPDTQRIRLEHTDEVPEAPEERERKTRLNVAGSIETNGDLGNAPDTDIELPKCGNGTRDQGRSEQTERS